MVGILLENPSKNWVPDFEKHPDGIGREDIIDCNIDTEKTITMQSMKQIIKSDFDIIKLMRWFPLPPNPYLKGGLGVVETIFG